MAQIIAVYSSTNLLTLLLEKDTHIMLFPHDPFGSIIIRV